MRATLQDLSSGAFGFVQLARNQSTNELVAIKFIERGDRVNKYVEAEILNHRMLRHPHVIEFKEVFLTSEYICIAMEYAAGGNLFSYVQRAVSLKVCGGLMMCWHAGGSSLAPPSPPPPP